MSKVVFSITVSLDGFVAGPNDNPENGMGDGGLRLFDWYFNGTVPVPISDGQMILKVSPQSAEILQEHISMTGAGIWGRRTFDIARGWDGHPPTSPCFIVTHHAPEQWSYTDSPFIFVTDGVESAVHQAKIMAGEKNVVVSTANIFQQCLKKNLIDEIHLDLVPVLLGSGVRLFDKFDSLPIQLKLIRSIETPDVTHLSYQVLM